MLDNYEWKFDYMVRKQKHNCTGCDKLLFGKCDMAHNLSRTKMNRKNYPLMIDSLLNLTVQHNHCNVGRKPAYGKKPMNPYRAYWIENFLQRHPLICKFVNGEVK